MKSLFNKDNILYLALGLLIVAYTLITWFVPTVNNFFDLNKKLEEKRPELSEIQRSSQLTEKKDEPSTNAPKKIYENIYKDANIDTASVLTPVVDDIITIVKNNGIAVESVAFQSDNLDSSITSTVPKDYKVMEMNFSIKSTYLQLQNMLNELYKYDYLININNLKTYVAGSDYDNINTDMTLVLYAK